MSRAVTFLFLFLSYSAAFAGPCSVFSKIAKIPFSVNQAIFDWRFPEAKNYSDEKAANAKSNFVSMLEVSQTKPIPLPLTAEEKMAFIKAVVEPIEPPKDINPFTDKKTRTKWAKLIRTIDFKNGLYNHQIETLFRLLFPNYAKGDRLRDIVKEGIDNSTQFMLDNRSDKLKFRNALKEALKRTEGANPEVLKSRFEQIKIKTGILGEVTFTALALLQLAQLQSPAYLPGGKINSQSKNSAKVVLAWNSFRKIYLSALYSIYLYSSIEGRLNKLEEIDHTEKQATTTVAVLEERQNYSAKDTDPFKQMVLDNFIKDNGRPPSDVELNLILKVINKAKVAKKTSLIETLSK